MRFFAFFMLYFAYFSSAFANQQFLNNAAGVYKVRFKNQLMSGETYSSENILEVVPINEHAAYVRMKLEFANGHTGDVSGIATTENRSLVFTSKTENCVVSWTWDAKNVTSHADYAKHPDCSNFHGARGTLDAIVFPVSTKRTIRYLKRLKDSEQFKNAMAAYQS